MWVIENSKTKQFFTIGLENHKIVIFRVQHMLKGWKEVLEV